MYIRADFVKYFDFLYNNIFENLVRQQICHKTKTNIIYIYNNANTTYMLVYGSNCYIQQNAISIVQESHVCGVQIVLTQSDIKNKLNLMSDVWLRFIKKQLSKCIEKRSTAGTTKYVRIRVSNKDTD